MLGSEKTLKRVEYNCIGGGGSYKGGAVPPTDLKKMQVPKMSTWWDHLNIILPHVCAIQVCIYVDGGSYDDPKIDWLEADHFKWSVIIDLVWNRCCSVGYLWHCHLFMLLDTTT